MTPQQTALQLAVSLTVALVVPLGAIWYFTRVRLARPPVGKFNGRDIIVILGFVIALPYLFLTLPPVVMPALLAFVFAGCMSIGAAPLITRRGIRFAGVGALLAADLVTHIWLGEAVPPYWLVNSLIIGLVMVTVANLNVQGGMRLVNVTAFVTVLALYDITFATVNPITQQLADAFQGNPFTPAAGVVAGDLGATVGMGDLLAYSLFATAAYKAYGSRALRLVIPMLVIFGAIAPVAAFVVIEQITGTAPSLVPAQVFFGPAALIGYIVMRAGFGRERRMVEYLDSRTPSATPTRSAAIDEPVLVASEPS